MAVLIQSQNGQLVPKPSLAAAIASADVAGKTIVVTEPVTLAVSDTVPVGTALRVENGGLITISSGQTLTINGSFECGLYQAFGGTGTVTFGSGAINEVYPEWFGAVGDGATDDTDAVAKAIAAFPKIVFSNKTYKGNFDFYTFNTVIGSGIGRTVLIPQDTAYPVVTVSKSTYVYSYLAGTGFLMEGITIDGGGGYTVGTAASTSTTYTDNHGIRLYSGVATGEPNSSIGNITIRNCAIKSCAGHGVYLDGLGSGGLGSIYSQVAWVKIDNCTIIWNMGNGVRVEGVAHQSHITGASLIEKNGRGCPKPTFANNRNLRSQILYNAPSGTTVGFPAKHTIDGSTTIQTGSSDVWDTLTGSYAASISIHGAQSVTVRDSWIEASDIGIWQSSTVTSNTVISGNYLPHFKTYGIVLWAGKGVTIQSNEFYQDSSTGTAVYAQPVDATNLLNVTWRDNTYTNVATTRDLPAIPVSAGYRYEDPGEYVEIAGYYPTTTTSVTIDLSISTVNFIYLAHNITVNLINPTHGETYKIYIHQSTLSNTVAWDAGLTIKWANGGAAPVITTTNNRGDCFMLYYRSNDEYYEVSRATNIPS